MVMRHNSFGTSLLVFFGAMVCLSAFACADEKANHIQVASQANNAALERLSQVSFLATVEEDFAHKPKKYTVRYWRSGDKWRMSVKDRPVGVAGAVTMDLDVCSSDNDFRAVSRRQSDTAKASCVLDAPRPIPKLGVYNVWSAGLLSVHTSREEFSLAKLLASHEVMKVEVEGQGPDADLVFHIKVDGQTAAYWVSPHFNYLVRKSSSNPGSDERSQREILRFHEIIPGVFFPAQMEGGWVKAGVLAPVRRVTFTNVILDKPHPARTFQLEFPRGSQLFNQMRNQTYITDEEGKPIGPVRDLPKTALLPLNPHEDSSVEPSLTETKGEPRSWTRFILPASLGVLAIAAIVWVLRRRVD